MQKRLPFDASARANYTAILFVALLCFCYWLYAPALTGPFLFDDYPNLQKLSVLGDGVNSFSALRFYLDSGTAGPLGRPLSLVSFLIDDYSWPTDPYSFKYTNLLLHLLNGIMLFVLGRKLIPLFLTKASSSSIDLISVLVMGFWLFHPIHTSGIFQVVQRMNLLSTLFSSLAIISYLRARKLIIAGRSWRKPAVYIPLVITPGVALLGVLSKENGALVPAYILAIELALNSQFGVAGIRSVVGRVRWLYGVLPTLVIIIFLIYQGFSNQISIRDFDASERLLTESRIFWQYIGGILLPTARGTGLFHDDITISTSLLAPASTLMSIILWLAAIYMAWRWRKSDRLCIFSFGFFWFIGGHLLESTSLPLEIYFEHRNYFPSWGVIVSLGMALYLFRLPFPIVKSLIVTVLLFSTALSAYTNAHTWSSGKQIISVWHEEHPESARAWRALAASNAPKTAVRILEQKKNHFNDNLPYQLDLLTYACQSDSELNMARTARNILLISKRASEANQITGLLPLLAQLATTNACPTITISWLNDLLDNLLQNSKMQQATVMVHLQKAVLLSAVKKYGQAAEHSNIAASLAPGDYNLLAVSAGYFAQAGEYEQAMSIIKNGLELLKKNGLSESSIGGALSLQYNNYTQMVGEPLNGSRNHVNQP